MSQAMNVTIVGGSLCGLFCGNVLKRLGHNVRLLERNPTQLLHNQGAGVVAGGDVLEFFERYDRTRRSIAVTSHTRQHLDLSGRVMHREGSVQKMTSWDLLYHVLRANFDGNGCGYIQVPEALSEEGSTTYEYDMTVTDLSEHDGKIQVRFSDLGGLQRESTADIVLAADGAGSVVRQIFMPQVERKYAGYVAWRGTIPESELSQLYKETFVDKFTFFHSKGTQILAYLIPGAQGAVNVGSRLVNWVWYCNYEEDSAEYAELMTDVDGKHHRITLPVGKVQPDVWTRQKELATQVLPPQFAALVIKTAQPFVQAITDVLTTEMTALNGKVILTGDAVAGFRPHTAASTNQAASHAGLIRRMFNGEIDLKILELWRCVMLGTSVKLELEWET